MRSQLALVTTAKNLTVLILISSVVCIIVFFSATKLTAVQKSVGQLARSLPLRQLKMYLSMY